MQPPQKIDQKIQKNTRGNTIQKLYFYNMKIFCVHKIYILIVTERQQAGSMPPIEIKTHSAVINTLNFTKLFPVNYMTEVLLTVHINKIYPQYIINAFTYFGMPLRI